MARPTLTTAQRHWLQLLVATLGVAGSIVTAQLLLAERDWRVDLTPGRRYVLSPHSRRILDDLDRDVRITAFLRSDDPRNRDIEDLLHRLSLASPRLKYRVIDVNRSPALAREYGVDVYGALVVESGETRRDLSNPTEDTLLAAVVQVTRPGRPGVYFVTGHGERSLQPSGDRLGYSSARAALVTERYDARELRLTAESDIPADASVLIVAGPRSDFMAGELLLLDEYLLRGGGLLALLDPGNAPGLVALLRRYGIVAADEVVLDPENRLFAGDLFTLLATEPSLDHPVSAELGALPLLSQIRPVSFLSTPRAKAGIELLATSAASWRTADPEVLRAGGGDFVPGRDVRGPVPIGVSVLVRGDDPERQGRIIVLGDADFASDRFLGYLGNRDLLLNSVAWLAGEDNLIAARAPARVPGVQQFFVSDREGRLAFWLATIVQPGLVLLFGVAVYLRRRWRG